MSSLRSRVESFTIPAVDILSYSRELRLALENIGVSGLILDTPASLEEWQFVDQQFTLELLQDLRDFQFGNEFASIKIDGKDCNLYLRGKTAVVKVDREIRTMSSDEFATLRISPNYGYAPNSDASETLQDMVRTLMGFKFFDAFYGKSCPAQFTGWDSVEDFFSLYYCSVMLSRDQALIKKAIDFIPDEHRQLLTTDIDDVFSLVAQLENLAKPSNSANDVRPPNPVSPVVPIIPAVRTNPANHGDPTDYVKQAADLVIQFMSYRLPEHMDSTEWNILQTSRTDLLRRIDKLSKAHPYLLTEALTYLHYKGFTLLIPGGTPEHVAVTLNRLETGTFREIDSLVSETSKDLVDVGAVFLPGSKWNIDQESEIPQKMPSTFQDGSDYSRAKENWSPTGFTINQKPPQSKVAPNATARRLSNTLLKAPHASNVVRQHSPSEKKSKTKAATPAERELRKHYVLGKLSRSELQSARAKGYFDPGGLLDERSKIFIQSKRDIMKRAKTGFYHDLSDGETGPAKRIKINHPAPTNPASSPEWYRP